jgi:hypothetical protein
MHEMLLAFNSLYDAGSINFSINNPSADAALLVASAVNDSAPIHQSYKKTISFLYKKPPRLPLWKPGRFVCFICAFSSAHAITCGDS